MDGQDMEMMEGAQAVDRDPTWEVTRGSQSLNRTYEGIDTGNDSTAEVVGDSSIPDNGIIEAHHSHFNPEESSGSFRIPRRGNENNREVESRNGRPHTHGEQQKLSQKLFDMTIDLNFCCTGEEIRLRKFAKRAQDPCRLFIDSLGVLKLHDIPPFLESVVIESVGQLCHVYAVLREFASNPMTEEEALDECIMASVDRQICIEDVANAFAAGASKCHHIAALLREAGTTNLKVRCSLDWTMPELILREAVKEASTLRASRLRGPSYQAVFIPRSVDAVWTKSIGNEVIYSSYEDIREHLLTLGTKAVESIIFIGNDTAGSLLDILPNFVYTGWKFVFLAPQYGLLSKITLAKFSREFTDVKLQLMCTPATVDNRVPESWEMPYYLVNGSEAVRPGFPSVEKYKMIQYMRAVIEDLKSVGIIYRGESIGGVLVRDEATSTMIQTAVNGNVRGTRRGIGRGFRGGRGYRGHGPNRGPWRGGVVKNK